MVVLRTRTIHSEYATLPAMAQRMTRMRLPRPFAFRPTCTSHIVSGLVLLLALLLPVERGHAQDMGQEKIPAQYEALVSAVGNVVSVLEEISEQLDAEVVSDQARIINERLILDGPATGGFHGEAEEDMVAMMQAVERDLIALLAQLDEGGHDMLSAELETALGDLSKALEMPPGERIRIQKKQPHRYIIRTDQDRITIHTEDDDWWDEDDRWERKARDHQWKRDPDTWRDSWKSGGFDSWSDADVLGEWNERWPYQTQATYRALPAVRYNRVEGLFLGASRAPLNWSSDERGRIYGQGGYAFGMDEWQYRLGVETRLGSRQTNPNVDLKIGGSYQRSIDTDDLWKAAWGENTAAAFFFRNDFYDYYHTEGWTGYVVARMTRFAQLSAAYRSEEHLSLGRATRWSLFGEGSFRPNPAIDEGQLNSVVLTLDGGSIRDLADRPRGAALRLEAEIGQGLGGDFDFARYVGDVRTYARLSHEAGLSFRLRGGFSQGTLPRQRAFTLGGIGSVRGYHQNQFMGTRMALANIELALYDPDIADWLLNNVTILGLFDAGWTNGQAGTNAFSLDDLVTSAGFGVALDERQVRIEVSWPLRDLGSGREPSIWLRINPTF